METYGQVLQILIELGILGYIVKIQSRFAVLETKVDILMRKYLEQKEEQQ